MDGSRLYNAAVHLNVSLQEIIQAASLDILSLGGTKNGLVGTEALLIFNPVLQEGSDHLHKQTLQLLSKMRYLSAQYIPFFTEDLWKILAQNANQKAQELAAILQSIPQLSVTYPVETNQIFFSAPATWIVPIQEKIACHLWDAERQEIRWVTSCNTSEQDIQNIKMITKQLPKIKH
jgi:threonine aldolase